MRKNLKQAIDRLGFRLRGRTKFTGRMYHPVLVEALAGCRAKSDISDHLSSIFFYAVDSQPKLIVELGTRGGESTRALLAAAEVTESIVLSIDINDIGNIEVPFRNRWTFVQADDVAFGQSEFSAWCEARGLPPRADCIFIDTSHEYEHTQQELRVWAPLLSPSGTMMFHDTHMGTGLFAWLDGGIGHGWDNRRGVMRAIEEFLGRRYDESGFFDDLAAGFLVRHYPHCNGFTVLKRK